MGDVIANLLKTAGYNVAKEYYINDAGNQMNNLGKSVLLRYREVLEEKIEFPETCYQGDHISEIAAQILKNEGDKYLTRENEDKTITYFTNIAGKIILRSEEHTF